MPKTMPPGLKSGLKKPQHSHQKAYELREMSSGDLGKGITKWKKEHYNTTGLNKEKKMEFINRHNIPTKMFTKHPRKKRKKKS